MAEVSTERGSDAKFTGFLEGRLLPQAQKKGISWIGKDNKEMQVSSEWTNVAIAEGVWEREVREIQLDRVRP